MQSNNNWMQDQRRRNSEYQMKRRRRINDQRLEARARLVFMATLAVIIIAVAVMAPIS